MIALKAYIEIHTEPGSDIDRIAASVRNTEGVTDVCRVIGRADIMITVEGRDLREISDLISQKICVVRGITATETSICVDSATATEIPKPAVESSTSEQIPPLTFS
ncbi:MAG: Lrp/AsnC ligand binding domain-containing protein [Nitrososphaerales archaeon]